MKKVFIISIVSLFIFPILINASEGALSYSSIKVCPDGTTYGAHSDGNGKHWHKAGTDGNGFYAVGGALSGEPCPDYSKYDGDSSGNGDNSSSNGGATSSSKEKEKSSVNTIKKITVDDDEITISDNMTYQTEKKKVSIRIELTDPNSKVRYNNEELRTGDNTVNIVVTAENGKTKEYVLTINKVKVKGTATIDKFIIGNKEVVFKNNKATITKPRNLEYSYELNPKYSKLEIYINDNEVKNLDSLKGNDLIKLVVIDENDNESIYEIKVNSPYISYGLIGLVSVIVLIILIIVIKSKMGSNKQIKE